MDCTLIEDCRVNVTGQARRSNYILRIRNVCRTPCTANCGLIKKRVENIETTFLIKWEMQMKIARSYVSLAVFHLSHIFFVFGFFCDENEQSQSWYKIN